MTICSRRNIASLVTTAQTPAGCPIFLNVFLLVSKLRVPRPFALCKGGYDAVCNMRFGIKSGAACGIAPTLRKTNDAKDGAPSSWFCQRDQRRDHRLTYLALLRRTGRLEIPQQYDVVLGAIMLRVDERLLIGSDGQPVERGFSKLQNRVELPSFQVEKSDGWTVPGIGVYKEDSIS